MQILKELRISVAFEFVNGDKIKAAVKDSRTHDREEPASCLSISSRSSLDRMPSPSMSWTENKKRS